MNTTPTATNSTSRTVTALAVALGIFIVAVVLPKLVLTGAIPRLATTQGLELLLSLAAIMVIGKGRFSEYGFRRPLATRPDGTRTRWIVISLMAPLLGIAAALSILGLGGKGNPVVRSLTLPQIVLFVWVSSSLIEEVFTRGFLQGHLSSLSGRYLRLLSVRVELPVLISAVFFACMHLVLLLSGIDAVTMVVTFLFTLSIGLAAGYLRATTESLIPAFAVHILANVGGVIGGIIYAVFSLLTGGKLPGA